LGLAAKRVGWPKNGLSPEACSSAGKWKERVQVHVFGVGSGGQKSRLAEKWTSPRGVLPIRCWARER